MAGNSRVKEHAVLMEENERLKDALKETVNLQQELEDLKR